MARTFKEFLDVFIHGETLEEQRRKDARKRGNIISGEIAPRNVISGRIADRPAATISPEEMAEMDRVAAGVGPISIKPPPGRGLEPRFRPPTGRQPLIPEFPITPEGEAGARVPEVLPDTGTATGTAPGAGFDWAKFIEVAGTMGAALAPQGAFAKAGLAAAGLVRGERERGVKVATAEEETRRFGIETRLKEVDDAREQAKLDWLKDPSNPRSMENLLKLEQEKSRLRIELEAAKLPAKAVKAKIVEERREKTTAQQRKNRVRTAKNSVMSAIRRHNRGTEDIPQFVDLDDEQIKRVMEIIREMDITGDETTDEIIQRAMDALDEELLQEERAAKPESDTGSILRTVLGNIPGAIREERVGRKRSDEISAEELLGPIEETTGFITDEELLR